MLLLQPLQMVHQNTSQCRVDQYQISTACEPHCSVDQLNLSHPADSAIVHLYRLGTILSRTVTTVSAVSKSGLIGLPSEALHYIAPSYLVLISSLNHSTIFQRLYQLRRRTTNQLYFVRKSDSIIDDEIPGATEIQVKIEKALP